MCLKFKKLLLLAVMFVVCTSAVSAQYGVPTSARAVDLADNLIAWQTESGGWTKNTDFSTVKYQPGMSRGPVNRYGQECGTFDNNASIDEMRFLAMVYKWHGHERHKEAFMKGLNWMLEAQYPSGGWPQYYPLRDGYWDNVTYNDNAMVRILSFIRDMLNQQALYDFIGEENFVRLEEAYEKGIEYILKSQIEVNGHLTAWCQQHDPVTYEPRMGRAYEHPSIVSAESVGVVRFLMSIPDPSEEVRRAIVSALEWFELAQLPAGNWARFYDIDTMVPIFSGRDSIIRYQVSDIELERQQGYSWFNNSPRSLLEEARKGDYLDKLRESLPDHQPITIEAFADPAVPKFNSPKIWPAQTVSGIMTIDIELSMRKPENFEEIVIKIGNEEIYRGSEMHVQLEHDTSAMRNGIHALIVETTTKAGAFIRHSANFTVNNR